MSETANARYGWIDWERVDDDGNVIESGRSELGPPQRCDVDGYLHVRQSLTPRPPDGAVIRAE